MLLVTAALVMGAALPLQTPTPLPTPTPAVVNIPDTEINVCAIVTLDDLTAALRLEADAALSASDTTLAELQSLCDDDTDPPATTTPPPATTTPPATTEPPATLPPGTDTDCGDYSTQAAAQAVLDADASDPNGLDSDGDGVACELDDVAAGGSGSSGGDDDADGSVSVVPNGAPETGDGSTVGDGQGWVFGLATVLAGLLAGAGGYRAGLSRVPGSRC